MESESSASSASPSSPRFSMSASPVTREIAACRGSGAASSGLRSRRGLRPDGAGAQGRPEPDPARLRGAKLWGNSSVSPGTVACASAIATDTDPDVRAAAATALGRLNDDGGGALARLADAEPRVKLAALRAAGRVNAFADRDALVRPPGDADPNVRKRAAEAVGARRAPEALSALLGVAENDPDGEARGAACHALGLLGDASARPALERVAEHDSHVFARDWPLARISGASSPSMTKRSCRRRVRPIEDVNVDGIRSFDRFVSEGRARVCDGQEGADAASRR